MHVVDFEGFVQGTSRHERPIEIGAMVVAHVIHKATGPGPISWSTELIALEDLEFGLWL